MRLPKIKHNRKPTKNGRKIIVLVWSCSTVAENIFTSTSNFSLGRVMKYGNETSPPNSKPVSVMKRGVNESLPLFGGHALMCLIARYVNIYVRTLFVKLMINILSTWNSLRVIPHYQLTRTCV